MSDIMPLLPMMPAAANPRSAMEPAPDATGTGAFSSHIERALRSSLAGVFDPALASAVTGAPANSADAPTDGPIAAELAEFGDDGDADRDATDSENRLDAIRTLVATVLEDAPPPLPAAADPTRSTVAPSPSPVPMRPYAGKDTGDHSRTPGANGREIVRDIEALAPELRVRVERVIGRMEREFGHDVRLAETFRSQSRQDHLYAQGRSREGEVVTWTKHSRHTAGLAADFVVDGNWDNPVAYERLQRIAQEEGLRTLGARDAGHVELDVRAWGESVQAEAELRPTTRPATFTKPFATPLESPLQPTPDTERVVNGQARVAAVAQVAAVPMPVIAQIARVATVDRPGYATTSTETKPRRSQPEPGVSEDRSSSDGSQSSSGDVPLFADSRPAARPAAVSADAPQPAGATAAHRAEQVEVLRDLVRSQPVSGLVLRIDSADGVDDRIRIDVRGTRVDASIGVNSELRATDLARRIPELTRALEARGFDAGATQVHTATATVRAHEMTGASQVAERLVVDALGNTSNTQNDSHSRDSDEPPARSQHQFRERSRRERQGDHT